MKKIHIITKYFYPKNGGIEKSLMQVYGKLVNDEFNIIVHTSRYDEKLKKEEKIEGLYVKRYDNLVKEIIRLKLNKDDIIIINNFEINIALVSLVKAVINKKIYRKNIFVEFIPHGGFVTNWKRMMILKRMVKKAVHYSVGVTLVNMGVNLVRAASEWEKQNLINAGINEELVIVLSQGIEDEAFCEHETRKDIANRYFLIISKLRPDKNIVNIVKAMKEIDFDIRLTIVGEATNINYLVKIQKAIQSSKLSKRITILNSVDNFTKYELINNAEVLVHLSEWENYGSVVHEAMAQKLIVLVKSGTGAGENIIDGVNGYKIGSTSPKIIARKLLMILNEINRNKVKEEAFNAVRNERREIIAKKLVKIYREI